MGHAIQGGYHLSGVSRVVPTRCKVTAQSYSPFKQHKVGLCRSQVCFRHLNLTSEVQKIHLFELHPSPQSEIRVNYIIACVLYDPISMGSRLELRAAITFEQYYQSLPNNFWCAYRLSCHVIYGVQNDTLSQPLQYYITPNSKPH